MNPYMTKLKKKSRKNQLRLRGRLPHSVRLHNTFSDTIHLNK